MLKCWCVHVFGQVFIFFQEPFQTISLLSKAKRRHTSWQVMVPLGVYFACYWPVKWDLYAFKIEKIVDCLYNVFFNSVFFAFSTAIFAELNIGKIHQISLLHLESLKSICCQPSHYRVIVTLKQKKMEHYRDFIHTTFQYTL